MTVQTLLASLDSAELSEWIAFYQLEAEKAKGDPVDEAEAFRRAFNA